MKRVKRIEWNNVSLVVDVANMSVAISRDSPRAFSSLSRLARFARSPVLRVVVPPRYVNGVVAFVPRLLFDSVVEAVDPILRLDRVQVYSVIAHLPPAVFGHIPPPAAPRGRLHPKDPSCLKLHVCYRRRGKLHRAKQEQNGRAKRI